MAATQKKKQQEAPAPQVEARIDRMVDGDYKTKAYAGLIQIDGDYYYVNSYCKVITSQRYWVSKTNNLLPATFYTFGADGKMVR